MDFAAVGPASPGARAQLLLGLLVCAFFPPLCLLTVAPQSHGVTIDAVYGLGPDGRLAPEATPAWFEVAPPRRDRRAGLEPAPLYRPRGPGHIVAIDPAGTLWFDGCAVDAVTL